MSVYLAKFVVPSSICREVCASPGDDRGVLLSYAGVDVVEAWFESMPRGSVPIMLHKAMNARRLVGWFGLLAHGGSPSMLELNDIRNGKALHHDRIFLHAIDGWAATSRHPTEPIKVLGGIASPIGQQAVSRLLDPPRVGELWSWLAGWVNEESPAKRPLGAYRSEEDYQFYTRQQYHDPDPDIDISEQ